MGRVLSGPTAAESVGDDQHKREFQKSNHEKSLLDVEGLSRGSEYHPPGRPPGLPNGNPDVLLRCVPRWHGSTYSLIQSLRTRPAQRQAPRLPCARARNLCHSRAQSLPPAFPPSLRACRGWRSGKGRLVGILRQLGEETIAWNPLITCPPACDIVLGQVVDSAARAGAPPFSLWGKSSSWIERFCN